MGDSKVRYTTRLRRELNQAQERYDTASHLYSITSISDPLWEEVKFNRDNSKLNLMTAESRLEKVNRDSSVEEYNTTTLDNNKNQNI